MSTLCGYVRNIVVNGDKCIVEKPNLYYKRLDTVLEVRVDIDDICEELIDYLVCASKPMTKICVSNVVLDKVISINELYDIYDEIMDTELPDNTQVCCQMFKIRTQCDAICRLAGFDVNNAYFEFSVSYS